MKKRLLVTLLSISSLLGVSQKAVFYQTAKTFSFGPRFGFNTSTLFFNTDEKTEQQGIRLNWTGGVWGRYQISDRWSVQTNVDYAPRGSKRYRLNYIDVPVTLAYNVRYKMFNMPFNFDAYVGIQPSFLTKATFSGDINGSDIEFDAINGFRNTTGDIVFGSGFPMWRFLFYATNKISLTKQAKVNGFGLRRGWSTEWFIAYRFGASNSFTSATKDEVKL